MKKLMLTIVILLTAGMANASGNLEKVCDKANGGSIAAAKIIAMNGYVCKNGFNSNTIAEKYNKDFVIESFYKSSRNYYRAEITIYNTKIKRITCRALIGKTVVGSEELYVTDKWETIIVRVANGNATNISCTSYTAY